MNVILHFTLEKCMPCYILTKKSAICIVIFCSTDQKKRS